MVIHRFGGREQGIGFLKQHGRGLAQESWSFLPTRRRGWHWPHDVRRRAVQRWLPDARVVKAFNIVGSAHMFRPQFPGGPPDMFIGGNGAGAKQAVTEILAAFGWPSVVDLGGIESARLLEPLAMVWIVYGIRSNSWNHAFKLLRK